MHGRAILFTFYLFLFCYQQLRLVVPFDFIDFDLKYINLDAEGAGSYIHVLEPESNYEDGYDTDANGYFKVKYKTLIIRVQDSIDDANKVPQSESTLYNDFLTMRIIWYVHVKSTYDFSCYSAFDSFLTFNFHLLFYHHTEIPISTMF